MKACIVVEGGLIGARGRGNRWFSGTVVGSLAVLISLGHALHMLTVCNGFP